MTESLGGALAFLALSRDNPHAAAHEQQPRRRPMQSWQLVGQTGMQGCRDLAAAACSEPHGKLSADGLVWSDGPDVMLGF